MIRSLKGNQTTLYRDLKSKIESYKDTLDKELLSKLKRILYNNNSFKFIEYNIASEIIKSRNYKNYFFVDKNLLKVE